MSDQSQGPGWWYASDGKWYPPESHPDYAPLPPPPPPPEVAESNVDVAGPRNVAMAGAAAVIVGCFMPWAKVAFITLNGTDADDFPIFLIAGAALLWLAWKAKGAPLVILGAAITLLWFVEFQDIQDREDEAGIEVSLGVGLWFILAGAITAGVAGFVITNRK